MTQIDTSFYRPQQQPNMLTQFGQAAGAANAMMQNRIMQEQFLTNMATGQAYRQAVDPATGQIDPAKLTNAIVQGPAAYNLPQVMQQVQEQKQRAVGLEKSEYDLAKERLGSMRSTLGALLANPNVSGKDVIASTAQLVAQGIATPKMAAEAISGMPQDPKQLKVWLTDHLVNTMTAQEKLNAAYGTPQMVAGVDAQGRPMQMPVAVSPIAGVSQLPVAGAAPGAMAGAGAGGPMAGAPGAPGRTATGAQGIVTGMAPGQKEAMEKSAASYQTLREDVGQSAQRVFQLNEALRGLQGSNTGPGTKFRNLIESYVMAVPGAGNLGLVDEKGVVNFDKAAKYLTQIASSQPGAMGSDAKLATAALASPSTEISNKAAQDIVKSLVAFERTKQAQADVFAKTGALPGEFSDWAVQWNKNVDPRAFSLDLMPQKERGELIAGLKGAERRKFLDSVKLALGAGVIDPAAFQTAVAAKK